MILVTILPFALVVFISSLAQTKLNQYFSDALSKFSQSLILLDNLSSFKAIMVFIFLFLAFFINLSNSGL